MKTCNMCKKDNEYKFYFKSPNELDGYDYNCVFCYLHRFNLLFKTRPTEEIIELKQHPYYLEALELVNNTGSLQ